MGYIYVTEITPHANGYGIIYGRNKSNNIVAIKVDYKFYFNRFIWVKDFRRFKDFCTLYHKHIRQIDKLRIGEQWIGSDGFEILDVFDQDGNLKELTKGTPYRICLSNQYFLNFMVSNCMAFAFDVVHVSRKQHILMEMIISMKTKFTADFRQSKKEEQSKNEEQSVESFNIINNWVEYTFDESFVYILKRMISDNETISKLKPVEAHNVWRACFEKIPDPIFNVLIYDIECGPKYYYDPTMSLNSSGNPNHIIQMVSLIYLNRTKNCVEREILLNVERVESSHDSMVGEAKLTICKTQDDLIVEFLDRVMDCDILSGHNILNYDNQEILIWLYLSTSNRLQCYKEYYKEEIKKALNLHSFMITKPWQIVYDSYVYYSLHEKTSSKSLAALARDVATHKIDLPYTEIWQKMLNYYTKNNLDDCRQVLVYCLHDSEIVLLLLRKHKYLVFLKYCSSCKMSVNEFMTSRSTVPNIGQTSIISFISKNPISARFSMSCNLLQSLCSEKPKGFYGGGYVLDVNMGGKVYERNVSVFDYAGLYPSVTIAYNIGESSIVMTESDFNMYMNQIEKRVRRNILAQSKIVKENGCIYFMVPSDNPNVYGFIKRSMLYYVETRKSVKQLLRQAKTDDERDIYESQQLALKLAANGSYGKIAIYTNDSNYIQHLKYTEHGFLRNRDVGACITICGQEAIKFAKDITEKNNFGTVVYGDTDSIFVKDADECLETFINSELLKISPYLKMENEGFFHIHFQDVKKKYILVNVETQTIKIRGIPHYNKMFAKLIQEICKTVATCLYNSGEEAARQLLKDEFIRYTKQMIDNPITSLMSQKINIYVRHTAFHHCIMFYEEFVNLQSRFQVEYVPVISENQNIPLSYDCAKQVMYVPINKYNGSLIYPVNLIGTLFIIFKNFITKKDLPKEYYDRIIIPKQQEMRMLVTSVYPIKCLVDREEHSVFILPILVNSLLYFSSSLGHNYSNTWQSLGHTVIYVQAVDDSELDLELWDQVSVNQKQITQWVSGGKESVKKISIELIRQIFDAKSVVIEFVENNNIQVYIYQLMVLLGLKNSARSLKEYINSDCAKTVLLETPIGYLYWDIHRWIFYPSLTDFVNSQMKTILHYCKPSQIHT